MSKRQRAAFLRARATQWQYDVEHGMIDTRKAQLEARREEAAERELAKRIEKRRGKYTIPQAFVKILRAHGPMSKPALYAFAVEQGYIKPFPEPRSRMHSIVGKLKQRGLIGTAADGRVEYVEPKPVAWVLRPRPGQPALSSGEALQQPEEHGEAA